MTQAESAQVRSLFANLHQCGDGVRRAAESAAALEHLDVAVQTAAVVLRLAGQCVSEAKRLLSGVRAEAAGLADVQRTMKEVGEP